MRCMGGAALFAAGMVVGMFAMQPAAMPQQKGSSLRLNHFGLYVKNLDESTEFYTKKMGFRPAFTFKDAAGKPIVYLHINRDTFLEMTPADTDHPAGVSHVGIWADDVRATATSLKDAGVKVEDVHQGSTKAPLANLFDPNGVRLELLSYPPESSQAKAMASWK